MKDIIKKVCHFINIHSVTSVVILLLYVGIEVLQKLADDLQLQVTV